MPSSPRTAAKSPRSSPPSTLPTTLLSMALLAALLAFARDAMHGQFQRNGYIAMVRSLVAATGNGPTLLPGSSDRVLLRRYTGGVAPGLDKAFTLANVLFANVADGSRPELSLYAVQFAGQIVPAFVVLLVEGLRVGNRRNLLRGTLLWGLAIQVFGFGLVIPAYALLHLFLTSQRTSDLTTSVLLRDPVQLRSIVPAILLGYVLPSALAAVPFAHSDLRQWCNVVWQLFPLQVVLYQTVFAAAIKRTSVGLHAGTPAAEMDGAVLRRAYAFALRVATLTQWTTYACLVLAAVRPDLFPGASAASLTFAKVFVPGHPHSFAPMVSPAAAFHDFVLYDQYAGAAAGLVWAAALLRLAGVTLGLGQVVGIVRDCVVHGPCGAMLKMVRRRDEVVLDKIRARK